MLDTKMHAKSLQSYLTLCNPMDCSPPSSFVHGILQARILEWVAVPSSRGSSPNTKKCLLNTTLYDLRISMPHARDWSQSTLPRTGKFKSYFTPPPEMKAHSPGGGSLGWEKDKNTDGDMWLEEDADPALAFLGRLGPRLATCNRILFS